MAADFDFDGTFNEDAADENQDNLEPGTDQEKESAQKPNRLRLILLILLVLILVCAGCFLVLRIFGDSLPISIPGITPGQPDTPTPVPATEEAQLPPEETTEPVPTEEPIPEEPTPTEELELPVTAEPTEEPIVQPTEEPTVEPTEEPTVEPTEEVVLEEPTEEPLPGPTATTVPVPGPTSTPHPTVVAPGDSCDGNNPPIAEANGPYTAMMGKGQAFVIFDPAGSTDAEGTIEGYEWDFGDGSAPQTGQSVTHGYTSIGGYVAVLTVTDNCGATGQDTAEVTIVGPTPPSQNNGTPAPTSATMGFCYRVQYGDTLSGLAWHYGLPLRDLAAVNGVSMDYFVIAGQGLFIPTGEIKTGPNTYQVQAGDTLNSIAYQCGLTIKTLATANGLAVDTNLTPGQLITVPPWRQVNP